jgi:hypothetical protein
VNTGAAAETIRRLDRVDFVSLNSAIRRPGDVVRPRQSRRE